jgi:hypothetical protein
MAIPELEAARVRLALENFCKSVPAAIQSELSYEYRVEGNTVMLLERRPRFDNPRESTELEIAKFVYRPRIGGWSLRWSDRNGRWHRYEGFENHPRFSDVLAEVRADPTGIFFG